MKNLITIFIMLVVVGCGKSEVENKRFEAELKEEQRKSDAAAKAMPKELTLEEKVVGGYQSKYNGNTLKYVFMENGIGEWFLDGKKEQEYKWTIVNGEIHAEDDDIYIYRINDDLSITYIAIIRDGKRDDSIKFADITFKRIK